MGLLHSASFFEPMDIGFSKPTGVERATPLGNLTGPVDNGVSKPTDVKRTSLMGNLSGPIDFKRGFCYGPTQLGKWMGKILWEPEWGVCALVAVLSCRLQLQRCNMSH